MYLEKKSVRVLLHKKLQCTKPNHWGANMELSMQQHKSVHRTNVPFVWLSILINEHVETIWSMHLTVAHAQWTEHMHHTHYMPLAAMTVQYVNCNMTDMKTYKGMYVNMLLKFPASLSQWFHQPLTLLHSLPACLLAFDAVTLPSSRRHLVRHRH